MTQQTTTSSGPAVSEASLAKIRALSASSDAVSGASSGGQGGKSISRLAVALIIGGVLLMLLCALSFAVGSRMFTLDRSIDGFLHPEANTIESKLIWAKRAPRTAAALLVGAALAVSGVLMQALSRNPLAEPGLLGVNSGAAASVVVGVGVFGVSSPFVQLWLALLGSGLAAALVFVMGLVDSKPNLDSTARLVLTGVAVNACLGTITGIITMFNSRAFDSHRFWVVGSLENRTFEQVLSALPFVALGLVLSFMLIGFNSSRPEARKAALQSLVVTGGGGLALFAGILLIGATLGRSASLLTSMIGPASPPTISSSSAVARSIAWRASCESTPRSKRCDASVCRP